MSDYFTEDDLKALLPAQWLTAALDDDGDELAEMFSAAREAATMEVNGKVGLRYALPLVSPVPEFVRTCALYFAAEVCYGRRQAHEQFPFADMVRGLRKTLDSIATGAVPLYPIAPGAGGLARPSPAIVGEASKIHSARTNA